MFDIINASLITREENSLVRKCIECALISTANLRRGSYAISPIIVNLLVVQCDIRNHKDKLG